MEHFLLFQSLIGNGCFRKSDIVLFDYGNDVHANHKQPISQQQLSSTLESTFHGFGGRRMRIAVAEVIHGALFTDPRNKL